MLARRKDYKKLDNYEKYCGVDTLDETFAVSGTMFYLNEEKMKKERPNLYKYFKNLYQCFSVYQHYICIDNTLEELKK